MEGRRYKMPERRRGESPNASRADERSGESSAADLSIAGVPAGRYGEAIARRFEARECETLVRDRCEALSRSIRRARKRRESLLAKVAEDERRARDAQKYREHGELLKGAFGTLRRGMDAVEVVNYFDVQATDTEMSKLTIPLDPALSPKENIERYFKRYRKGQRALPYIEERRRRLEGELALLEEARQRLDAMQDGSEVEPRETIEQVAELEAEVASLFRAKQRRRSAATSTSPRRLGPKRFVSVDGVEILVGRNARGNDELTLRLARGNDYFFHVSGRAGAHVVARVPPRQALTEETLLDAAHLALWFSLPERRRRYEDGLAAEVDYTQVKHVKKPAGTPAGLVYLVSHKTLRCRAEEARLARLLRTDAPPGGGPR